MAFPLLFYKDEDNAQVEFISSCFDNYAVSRRM